MSLEDRTNEEIELTMPGQGTLSVDIDRDSHVWPEPWVWLMFDGGDEHWSRLTLEEAGMLHDRLGLILGRAQDGVVQSAFDQLHWGCNNPDHASAYGGFAKALGYRRAAPQ